jgi:hypothetical protein
MMILERLEAEVRELRRIIQDHTTEIALLKAWRTEHGEMHKQDRARHAQQPSIWMTAIMIAISFSGLIVAILLRGGP